MDLLNSRGVGRWDHEADVGMSDRRTSIAPRQQDAGRARQPRRFETPDDALRPSTRGKADHDVARHRKGLDLSGEDDLVPEVIPDACQDRWVDRERDGRQRTPRPPVPPDQLGRQMLGIGGTPAVAERVQATAGLEGRAQTRHEIIDGRDEAVDLSHETTALGETVEGTHDSPAERFAKRRSRACEASNATHAALTTPSASPSTESTTSAASRAG